MGEIADMMLDGILDANGEYTGRNYGYPVYPKGWFGDEHKKDERLERCISLCKQFGCRNRKAAIKKLYEYATIIDKPTISQVAKSICSTKTVDRTEWNKFKKWLKGGLPV